MMWSYHDGMGWWMLFWGLWSLLFWVVVVGLVVWAVTRISGGRAEKSETALDIARMRLARGEITQQEFEELRKALS